MYHRKPPVKVLITKVSTEHHHRADEKSDMGLRGGQRVYRQARTDHSQHHF
jgi:hypothetical protein